ncbi:MAG: YebG family protein [Desulfobacterales bacterium]
MAVITRFVVVRNGVELDETFTDRRKAEAFDKMLDAAEQLSAFIRTGSFDSALDERTIEAISLHLAKNAPEVSKILKGVKPARASEDRAAPPAAKPDAGRGKKKSAEVRPGAGKI